MKKLLIGFIIYYTLGFVIMNAWTISRFLYSANIFEIVPTIILRNILSPLFWGLTFIWPGHIGLGLYSLFTGNFVD